MSIITHCNQLLFHIFVLIIYVTRVARVKPVACWPLTWLVALPLRLGRLPQHAAPFSLLTHGHLNALL